MPLNKLPHFSNRKWVLKKYLLSMHSALCSCQRERVCVCGGGGGGGEERGEMNTFSFQENRYFKIICEWYCPLQHACLVLQCLAFVFSVLISYSSTASSSLLLRHTRATVIKLPMQQFQSGHHRPHETYQFQEWLITVETTPSWWPSHTCLRTKIIIPKKPKE